MRMRLLSPLLVLLSAAPSAHGAEVWPKLVEKGFEQDTRIARLGETKVFEGMEFWVEPDYPEAEACRQHFDEAAHRLTIEFTRRGRCSVKFTKGLTGYEVGYVVERDPKDFLVPGAITLKVGETRHLPCVSAIVFARSEVVKLLPDIEENGWTYVEGRKAGTEEIRCTGRREKKTIPVTVTP